MSASRGRLIAVLAAAGALMIVGVVIGVLAMQDKEPAPSPGVEALQNAAASMAALPACAEVFIAGQTIDDAKGTAGCKNAQGVVQMGSFHTCSDGRHLFTVDAPRGWGFGGEEFHQTIEEVAADAAFSTAYAGCVS